MSINKLISIKTPIVDAMESLNIDHDKLIPKFTRWAVLAEKEIGSTFQFEKKKAVLDVVGCVANLPNDAAFVQVAILGDHGCGCDDLMNTVCGYFNPASAYGTASNTFLVIDVGSSPDNPTSFSRLQYEIQNNKLILPYNKDASHITIQYYGAVCDEDGFPKVGENHVLALTWYIKWNYYQSSWKNSLDYGFMNKCESEWHRECSHARAQDNILSESDRRLMVGQYHNPYVGIGLSIGMYTTLGNAWNPF